MEHMIEQFSRAPYSALLVLPDLFTATNRRSIIALAAQHRLPAVYPARYFVASGGLMSYGIELLETYRRQHPMSTASSRVKGPVSCRSSSRPNSSLSSISRPRRHSALTSRRHCSPEPTR